MSMTQQQAVAALKDLKRVELKVLYRTAYFTLMTGAGPVTLFTNNEGDELWIAQGASETKLLNARDFSVNKYDLGDEAGKRAAREYAKRKLKKLADMGDKQND